MILKASQRGGAKQLGLHLLKDENDHVTVHEIRGFASDDVVGAMKEAYAVFGPGTHLKAYDQNADYNALFESIAEKHPENADKIYLVSFGYFGSGTHKQFTQTGL